MENEVLTEHLANEREKDDLAKAICALTWALVKWDDTPASALAHLDQAYGILTELGIEAK